MSRPLLRNARSVRGPTPHSAPTGRGRRNSRVSGTGTTTVPSGFAIPEASLATNFTPATPTEQVMPNSSATRARSRVAIPAGPLPSLRNAPLTSRNASSRPSGCTAGVTSANSAITPRETSL